jgi:hypothetical protein
MRKNLTLLLLAASLGFPVFAQASPDFHPYTGNELLADCNSNEPLRYAKCMAFEQGVVEGVQAADTMHGGKAAFFEIPDGVTVGQCVAVVKKYLNDHPEKLHLDATFSILQALHAAFPQK